MCISRLSLLMVATAIGAATATCVALAQAASRPARRAQPALGARSAPILEVRGQRFRDLNRSGTLEPYEDWRLAPDARARDLVARMTLEEKAGAMMHGTARTAGAMAGAGVGAGYDTAANRKLIGGANVNSLVTRLGGDPSALAAQNNLLQEIAEGSRLGIPLTVSTDPRNHFQYVLGASEAAGIFPTSDRHVRLRTSMQIYWDQAFVARDAGGKNAVVTTLAPMSADLHARGFSRTYRKGGRYGPYWFDYDVVSKTSPWRPITGAFTRFGDVLSLLHGSDDMYIVMAPK